MLYGQYCCTTKSPKIGKYKYIYNIHLYDEGLGKYKYNT